MKRWTLLAAWLGLLWTVTPAFAAGLIIVVDAHEVEILSRRKLDKNRPMRTMETVEAIREHKIINHNYASAFSAMSASLLRLVQNNTGEFEKAVADFAETLRYIDASSKSSGK